MPNNIHATEGPALVCDVRLYIAGTRGVFCLINKPKHTAAERAIQLPHNMIYNYYTPDERDETHLTYVCVSYILPLRLIGLARRLSPLDGL